ncbi:MAG: phosphodiesterase [candidate division TM6 bacterium GW2011_GWF2_32_72]|nr:MAG: phosphodiesterase [candidate division TM6 bacterium GW2011_GWF2_32_72]
MFVWIIGAVSLLIIAIGLVILRAANAKFAKASELMSDAKNRWKNVKQEIETERREALLKLKDEIYKKRNEFELEIKRDKITLERLQNKLNDKSESLEKKEQQLDDLKRELQQKERAVSRNEDMLRLNETKLKNLYDELINKLERSSNMTQEEAKQALFDTLKAEVQLASQKWVQKVEEEARQTAKQKSIDIVIGAMQRFSVDQVAPHASNTVQLPNEDMKGRIIGKEGRNIKSLEMATGMEFVIGEIPEIITISGFNPVRREVAKRALEVLVADGRINPTKIEETVAKCEQEVDEIIEEKGREAVLEFNLQGVHMDIIKLLGKLHFRTSFSQNVLAHSKEVAFIARMLAEELGLDGKIALRAGLFHDIGKALSEEIEGPHASIGADVLRRCGEDARVVNAVAAHHEESEFKSEYAPIVLIADAISASRPGARRETLSAYLKRLEKLEEIANSFEGVKKAYALQAGREIRVIVQEDFLTDEKSAELARNLAQAIEANINFPGQIKVNVIREKRAIEYAR